MSAVDSNVTIENCNFSYTNFSSINNKYAFEIYGEDNSNDLKFIKFINLIFTLNAFQNETGVFFIHNGNYDTVFENLQVIRTTLLESNFLEITGMNGSNLIMIILFFNQNYKRKFD